MDVLNLSLWRKPPARLLMDMILLLMPSATELVIKQMKIWMEEDRHESKITAFSSEAMRFTERADDYEAKIAGLQEKLPALWRAD